jgi:hypothetical protein
MFSLICLDDATFSLQLTVAHGKVAINFAVQILYR